MAKALVHNKILKAAAREVLRPLGLQQQGRSRLWYEDFGWQTIAVGFQPSQWTRGSYLGVSVQWLWYPRDYWVMDFGGRENGYIEFEDETQFRNASLELARLGAERFLEYRGKLATLEEAYATLAAYCATPPQPPRQLEDQSELAKLSLVYAAVTIHQAEGRRQPGHYLDLHLGILAALKGEVEEAGLLAARAKIPDPNSDFEVERNYYIDALLDVIDDPIALRAWLEKKIAECRALLKLEALPGPVLPAD